jgi:hypothetical protein
VVRKLARSRADAQGPGGINRHGDRRSPPWTSEFEKARIDTGSAPYSLSEVRHGVGLRATGMGTG